MQERFDDYQIGRFNRLLTIKNHPFVARSTFWVKSVLPHRPPAQRGLSILGSGVRHSRSSLFGFSESHARSETAHHAEQIPACGALEIPTAPVGFERILGSSLAKNLGARRVGCCDEQITIGFAASEQ